MRTASAPASSANLGPGFDILALALDLRCQVAADPASAWTVTSGGVPASDAAVEMVRRVAGTDAPHSVSIESRIPQAAGLGSSAALLVAAAAALQPSLDATGVFQVAAEVEGHPDNVAAAAFGGLVGVRADGMPQRLVVHPALHVVVAVPDEQLATTAAREVVPDEIPRAVAVRTSARLLMLVEGLRQADNALLGTALGDELHEAPRSALTGTPNRLIAAALDARAMYAAWSGAGPSVIAFCTEDDVDAVIAVLETEVGPGGAVLEPSIDREGVRIE